MKAKVSVVSKVSKEEDVVSSRPVTEKVLFVKADKSQACVLLGVDKLGNQRTAYVTIASETDARIIMKHLKKTNEDGTENTTRGIVPNLFVAKLTSGSITLFVLKNVTEQFVF